MKATLKLKKLKLLQSGVLVSSLFFTSCATSNGPKTAVQKALGQCVVSVGAGAVLGAVIGNNSGSGNAKKGALKGALAGSGVCAFLLYRASEEDKARIADLELEALNNPTVGVTQRQFTSTNGRDVFNIKTTTSDIPKEEYPEYNASRVAEVIPSPVVVENQSDETKVITDQDAVESTSSEWDTCRALNTNIESGGQVIKGQKRYACRTKLGDWVNF